MSIIHSVPEFLLEGKKVRLSFAVQELALYLDTHRDDMEALALYRSYQKMLERCIADEEYEEAARSTPPRSKQKLPQETTFHIRSMPTARRLSIRLRSLRTAGFLLLR